MFFIFCFFVPFYFISIDQMISSVYCEIEQKYRENEQMKIACPQINSTCGCSSNSIMFQLFFSHTLGDLLYVLVDDVLSRVRHRLNHIGVILAVHRQNTLANDKHLFLSLQLESTVGIRPIDQNAEHKNEQRIR